MQPVSRKKATFCRPFAKVRSEAVQGIPSRRADRPVRTEAKKHGMAQRRHMGPSS